VADYVRYQADAGAQVVQIFDSWASHLSPQDFDVFSGPYIRRVSGARAGGRQCAAAAAHGGQGGGQRPFGGRTRVFAPCFGLPH
jgi:hypothetical protein